MTFELSNTVDRVITFVANFALLSGLVLGAAMFVSLSH